MLPQTTPPGSPGEAQGNEKVAAAGACKRVTRRAHRALSEAQEKFRANNDAPFAALPDELVLRVVRVLPRSQWVPSGRGGWTQGGQARCVPC